MKDLLITIKYFGIIFAVMFMINVAANAQSFKVEGNNYSAVKTSNGRSKTPPTDTGKTWTDNKGNTYPIYVTESGSCFTIRKSSTTGKEYRSYLKPDVSEDICKKIGIKYIPRNKKKIDED